MSELADEVATFAAGARGFAELVHRIPAEGWDGPGLGEWDLRALAGHTSRSLITVLTYLDGAAAENEDVISAVDYYAHVAQMLASGGAAVVERGRAAGRELGADPAASVNVLITQTLERLAGEQDRLITVIGGVGIRLSAYLVTRTFELVVHSRDIAAAIGVEFTPAAAALDSAVVLAARIAIADGHGLTALAALTGRAVLPPGFSVV